MPKSQQRLVQKDEKNDSAVSRPDFDPLVRLFEALSDRTRLRILILLANGERSVGALVAEFKLPQPTVSHHLGLLRMHGLIENRRAGKQIFYSVARHVSRDAGKHLTISLVGYNVLIAECD